MKKFFVLFLLFVGLHTWAQNNTFSPYTRYGLGDLSNNKFGLHQSLGGTGIAFRSPWHLNFTNPAACNTIAPHSFIFEVGAKSRFSEYASNVSSATKNASNIEYLSIFFPITKWWSGAAGLNPYSSRGYNMQHTEKYVYENDTINTASNYMGLGGINQIFWTNAFKWSFADSSALPVLVSAGVKASYLFGTIDMRNEGRTAIGSDVTYFNDIQKTKVGDFYFGTGMQVMLGKPDAKIRYTLGATLDNKSQIKTYNTRMVTRAITMGNRSYIDTLINTKSTQQYIELPDNLGVGIALTINNQLTWGADYYMQDWTKALVPNTEASKFANSSRISSGIEWQPKPTVGNYFSFVRYRAGVNYTKDYLQFDGVQLNDMSASIGFGFPLRTTIFNLSVAAGQRGTLQSNLVRERYLQLNLNFTLREDDWFIKPKFY